MDTDNSRLQLDFELDQYYYSMIIYLNGLIVTSLGYPRCLSNCELNVAFSR